MKTPLLKPLLITSLPVFASVFTAASIVWQLGEPKLAMPFVLGIIVSGLVDLDNRLTGRLKNIIATVALFTLSSLTAQSTLGTGLPFILAMTLMTFGFTILGAVGLKYRTFAFGALAVATYTTLTYTPETYWLTNPFMILCAPYCTAPPSSCSKSSCPTAPSKKASPTPTKHSAATSKPKPTSSTPMRQPG